MKKLLLIPLALLMSSCSTIPGGNVGGDLPEVAAVIIAEKAAMFRCPRNELEVSILMDARLIFDLATNITPETRMLVLSLRAQTNAYCGLTQP